MSVYVSNITIPSGADFDQTFTLESFDGFPFNLTGYTGSAMMKKSPASLNPTAIFNVSFPDRTLGKIRISLASTITSSIKAGRYSYDILINSGSVKKRVVEGSALVTAGITTM
jgi:hypothetical protein